MKIYQNFVRGIMTFALAGIVFYAAPIHAALVPTLSVSPITGGTTSQVTVFGADPNASVLLEYPGTTSIGSTNIGTTNSSGYLTSVVDAATYNIASGASVYVMVDSQASPSIVWPSYTSSGTLSLTQTNLILSTGQSSIVSASVSATLSMTSNTNPSVAGVSISGQQITVSAFNAGSTNITICASGLGCNTIYVTVQASGATVSNISFSQSNVNISVGQSQTVTISGSGSYYVNSNTNPAIASANLSGSVITIGGVFAGTDAVSICSSANNSVTCSSLNINVVQSATSVISTTPVNLTFGQSNINLSVGQSQSVPVYGGSGVYYVSANSAPGSVTANVSGTNVNLTGLAFGGDNITVCAANNQCGNVYVYVAGNSTAAPTVNSTVAPSISSFSISSNDQNGSFIGAGNTLTLTFSTNQSINIPKVTVGNSSFAANGSGNGPYTATYTMTGAETLPLPVGILFSNPAGSAGQVYVWVGTAGASLPVTAAVSQTPAIAPAVTSSAGSYVFTQYLYNGSVGADVTALQRRLTADGIYSGPITGTFGDLTEAGVKAYQKKHGLEQLGVVGPATRGLLNQGI